MLSEWLAWREREEEELRLERGDAGLADAENEADGEGKVVEEIVEEVLDEVEEVVG